MPVRSHEPNMHLSIGPSPPDDPRYGDMWFNTNSRVLHLWYPDQNAWLNLLEFVLSAAPYVGDETERNVTGLASTLVKEHRFSVHGRTGSIMVHAELKTTIGTTAFLEVYIDGVLKLTLSTTKTDYEVLMGTIDTDGFVPAVEEALPGPSSTYVHLIEVKLRNSDAGGTTTNRLYDFFFSA